MKCLLSLCLLFTFTTSAFALQIPIPKCENNKWSVSAAQWEIDPKDASCQAGDVPTMQGATYVGVDALAGTLDGNFGSFSVVSRQTKAFCPAGKNWNWQGDPNRPHCVGDVHTCEIKTNLDKERCKEDK
jgi:hypothetical protein